MDNEKLLPVLLNGHEFVADNFTAVNAVGEAVALEDKPAKAGKFSG